MCQVYGIHKPDAVYFLKNHWVSSVFFCHFSNLPRLWDGMEKYSFSFLPFVAVFRCQDIQEIWLLFLPIIITAKALHFCLLEPHTSGFFSPPSFWCLDKIGLIKGTIYLKKLPTNSSALLTQAYFHLNVDQSVYRCFRRDFYRKNGGGGVIHASFETEHKCISKVFTLSG